MKRTLGLTLLLFATLFSCMRQEKPLPAELSRAESVMWEHPDSALSILRSMPQSSLSSGKNYATWALLLAQARLWVLINPDNRLIIRVFSFCKAY